MRELIRPGLLILAARTGFTRTEILSMSLSQFAPTLDAFTAK